MKLALTRRNALWGLAIAATAAAAVWVDDGDEEIAAPAAGREAHRLERRAAAPGAAVERPLPALSLEPLVAHGFGDMKADLMAAKSWYVPPPPGPPPKPTAPALPFTVSGRLMEADGTTVFLSQQERNQIARRGDVIDKTWRVDEITATSMTFTYLPLNETKTLALGAAP